MGFLPVLAVPLFVIAIIVVLCICVAKTFVDPVLDACGVERDPDVKVTDVFDSKADNDAAKKLATEGFRSFLSMGLK